jgi:ketosteroid isomerase-like protein
MAAESEFVKNFKAIFDEGNRAWNEHDFRRAYGALPDDFIYELGPAWPEAGRAFRGPDEVVAFFEELRETFPDVQTGPTTYIEVDEQRMITGFDVVGTGRSSGTSTKMQVWQLWEIGEGFVPVRVVEYIDRSAALKAAGLEESAQRDPLPGEGE